VESFEARCLRVEAVTPADVLRVARKTFRRSRLVAVTVGAAPRRERTALERLLAAAPALPP
jgi:predicted Zn-dependent peptidase